MAAQTSKLLNYAIENIEGIKLLQVVGVLCSFSRHDFERIINRITEKESVIVNFENVRLVTAPGLYSVVDVSFSAKKHDRRVIVMKPSEDMLRLAEILDSYSQFITVSSFDEGKLKLEYFT